LKKSDARKYLKILCFRFKIQLLRQILIADKW